MSTSKSRNNKIGPLNPLEAEIAITALHATGDFKVLRKLDMENETRFTRKPVENSRIALCLDTETTGLDHTEDKVIELGIVAFEFNPATGEIIRITERHEGFEDPGEPLSEEIKEITGITDEMVIGQAFDDDMVVALAKKASLVIAHNAAFDRKFVESRFPLFATLPWACSVSQIDWQAERISARSLECLLYKCGGYYINAHRALEDAEGVLGLLLGQLPVSGTPIFKHLLEKSNEITSKICAVKAPYDKKDILKQRGYRWNDGSKGDCKSWWTMIPYEEEQKELDFLAQEIYLRGKTDSVEIRRIDALSRFSVREE
ncbi:MAG: Exonuclease RNase and polymerase [Geobacteraceae bacterium]|nr:Exonuclease RNase and polymerase [Geobacteraceae bacterium]